jgi:predicted nucleic acid-binding protein
VRPSVYLETSIVSYLAGRRSRDVIVSARQRLTHTWWRTRRAAFDVYISQAVLDEVRAGDAEAARKRLALASELAILDMSPAVTNLATALIAGVPLPAKAAADAVHIAVAAYHGVQFLLTWNSTHMANAELRPRIEQVCREGGYEPPILCTPDELMGGVNA